ncbi:hypothetical protein SLS60_002868 [Paraconiothyrium brasiliense]|uniref:Maintenance of telomere capping protein 6 n=1 Tax=Paraconiothyrium brasiliense TaxID=300254 RepID=A0ABR3RU18_9PLEO
MADSLYVPDPTAGDTLVQPWDEAFRAQRDVGLLIPINFHTVPWVSLRAACFGNGQYEDTSFQKCFSNLLAVGLRRFIVDTYWDASRSQWSLCPAQIPTASAAGSSSTVPVPAFTITSSLSSTSAGVTATVSKAGFPKRQDGSSDASSGSTRLSMESSSVPSPTSSSASGGSSRSGSSSSSSSATPAPSTSTSAPVQEGFLYQLGSYNCTSTITLNYLTGIFNDFLEATSTTTDASFTHLLLNIHAAASWQHPNEPAQQSSGDLLPQAAGNLLSNIMKGNLSEELYTPSKLADERANLRNSWNNVDPENKPRGGYYTVEGANGNDPSTEDGWPDEAYAQFSKYYRLIAIFGTIDPQMGGYNRSLDADTIFPSETISVQPDVSFSSSDSLNEGCLFDASDKTVTPQRNSSFAVAVVPPTLSVSSNPDLFSPIPAISNLTACGISPMLNHSLANTTADKNPLPYAAFTHSYLWSWAPGEPLNATDASISGATGNRCAAAYTEGAWPGRWHVVDCNTPLRVACQDPSSPYSWSISSHPKTYDSATNACASPSTFSVPHTPLENAHLLSAARAAPPLDRSNINTSSILINLNSMDVADCWVAEVNGTCPYLAPDDQDQTRIVVVPTVAAIIIFVVTALTFFVKCAANRRDDKRGRRRRMLEGWEYEGVPS